MNDRINSVSFLNCIPRIWSNLFKTKGNSSSLNIISKNHTFYFFADFYHIGRLVDFLSPTEFRNMGKTFNSFFQFDKGTKISKFCNCTFNNILNMILIFKMNPRIFRKMLKGQIDSFIFRIETNNFKFYFLTFFYKVFRTGYMTPTHIVNMQKTVESAQINKSTETCKRFYSSFYSIANLSFFKELIPAFIHCFFEIFSAVYNHIGLIV